MGLEVSIPFYSVGTTKKSCLTFISSRIPDHCRDVSCYFFLWERNTVWLDFQSKMFPAFQNVWVRTTVHLTQNFISNSGNWKCQWENLHAWLISPCEYSASTCNYYIENVWQSLIPVSMCISTESVLRFGFTPLGWWSDCWGEWGGLFECGS